MEAIINGKMDQNKWDNFVQNHKFGDFLQSWEWGEVSKARGNEIHRIAIFDDDKIIACASIEKYDLPFGISYLYVARGPVLAWDEIACGSELSKPKEAFILLLDEIEKIAQKENALFLRIDPPIEQGWENIGNMKFWQEIGFIKANKEIQPKMVVMLNLDKNEDDLLAQMKSKTRYNTRLCLKKGIKIEESTDLADIDGFYELMQKTGHRGGFSLHPKKNYQEIIEILAPLNMAKIFLAKYKGKLIAANIVSFFGNFATYMHGASDDSFRNLMPTYGLQWKSICEAKKMGCKTYDFGGVVSENLAKHSWAGISRFKRGFGATEKEFIGSLDLPYQKTKYKMFAISNSVRRKIKGYD